jgi:two-component system, cell cycle response regulator DivK
VILTPSGAQSRASLNRGRWPRGANTSQSALTGLNVLVVEDHDDSREALSRFISARGANVFAAEHGARALHLASVNRPDIVLCDLTMPVMDGYEFVRAFRARDGCQHIPVLAISALPPESARLDAARAGFDGYLPKPVDLLVLEARMVAVRSLVASAKDRLSEARERAEAASHRALAATEDVAARMLRAKNRTEK